MSVQDLRAIKVYIDYLQQGVSVRIEILQELTSRSLFSFLQIPGSRRTLI